MSDQQTDAAARPRTITIAGREYTTTPLALTDIGTLERWINQQVADPMKKVREAIEGLPEPIAEKIALEAFRMSLAGPIRFNTMEAARILDTPEGTCQVLHLLLKKRHPDVRMADVEKMMESVTLEDVEGLDGMIYGDGAEPAKTPG